MRGKQPLPAHTLLRTMPFVLHAQNIFANNNLVYISDLVEKSEAELYQLVGKSDPATRPYGLGCIGRKAVIKVLARAGHKLKKGPPVPERRSHASTNRIKKKKAPRS